MRALRPCKARKTRLPRWSPNSTSAVRLSCANTGPWDHLQGSSGADIGKAGYGPLPQLWLRWFDRYVKGKKDAKLLKDIKPFTYYEQGTGEWVRVKKYVDRDLRPASYLLSGDASVGGRNGALVLDDAKPGTSTLPAIPVTGLCTRSTNQWTAGILNTAWPDNPCLKDNQVNDLGGLSFQTAPMTSALRLQGPINVRLYTSTPSGDGMYSVAVEDVAPDGSVSRLTGGWQVVSQRELDQKKSRYLKGELIQPFHPFTLESKKPVPSGAVVPVDVEVFPTGAAIKPGHRLRLSIQAFDVPHLLPPLPNLAQIAPLTLHVSRRPTLGADHPGADREEGLAGRISTMAGRRPSRRARPRARFSAACGPCWSSSTPSSRTGSTRCR